MLVPLNDFVGRSIFFTGDYDRKVTWLCRQIVRPGDTVLDIGANLGVVSFVLAKLVGPTGIVHAFEPNPRLQVLLELGIEQNDFKNICLHKVALGSKPGELELVVPRSNKGQGSLIYHRGAEDCDTVSCRVQRLSDIVREQDIKKIRFVKIDVEGFENEVLMGAMDVLADIRPEAILFETNDQTDMPFKDRPSVVTLKNLGYGFLEIPKGLFSVRMRKIDMEQVEIPSHDVLAVPHEKYSAMAALLGA
jgi:FkbM family methyltransferase